MVSLFSSPSYILSQSLFSQVPGSSSDRTGVGLNRSPAGDSLQHLNSMNPTLVNIHDTGIVLFEDKTWETNTSPRISNTHTKTNSNIGNDINGHVINMYTHTKWKKALWISHPICVCISGYSPRLRLVCLHNLVCEWRCFTCCRESIHFFHRELPKVETEVRNQNTK